MLPFLLPVAAATGALSPLTRRDIRAQKNPAKSVTQVGVKNRTVIGTCESPLKCRQEQARPSVLPGDPAPQSPIVALALRTDFTHLQKGTTHEDRSLACCDRARRHLRPDACSSLLRPIRAGVGNVGGIPQGSTVIPQSTLPTLNVIRGSQVIGATAILLGGGPIGTVQDTVVCGNFGDYAVVSYANGFVTIPWRLTTFEPVPRVLQVNMTAAQLAELPLMLQISQLNNLQFAEGVHNFFLAPRGQAILKSAVARNTKLGTTHRPGGAENRAETRSAGKPTTQLPIRNEIHPQTRTEHHPENGAEIRR